MEDPESNGAMTYLCEQPAVSRLPPTGRLLRVGCGLIILSIAGTLLNDQSYRLSGVSLIWLANALLMGVLLRSPKRQWPSFLALGYGIDLALNLLQKDSLRSSAVFSACNLVEVLVGALLMYPTMAPEADLTEARQLRSFLLYGVLLAPAAASLMAACFLVSVEGAPFAASMRVWFAADVLGIATVLPLYLSYQQGKPFSLRSRLEVTSLFGLLSITTLAIFLVTTYPMLWLVLMVLLLLGVRLGFTGSALGLLAVTFIGGYLTADGHGPLSSARHGSLAARILIFQWFIAMSMFALYATEVAMSANRRIRFRLEASESRFRSMAEASRDIILLADLQRVPQYISPALTELLGWTEQDVLGKHFGELARPEHLPGLRATLDDLLEGREPRPFTYQSLKKDGSYVWLEATARLLRDEESGEPSGFVCVLRDVSERKAAEDRMLQAYEQVEQLALVDGLTGIANRRLLDQVLHREWQSGCRDLTPLTLLVIDVDHFKAYNDSYGHLEGDECLRRLAREIEATLRRPLDMLGRYGGEEFVAVLPNTPEESAEMMSELVRSVVAACCIPHSTSPHAIVTVSVGCATGIPDVHSDPSDLLRAADSALYRAKMKGRNRREMAWSPQPVL